MMRLMRVWKVVWSVVEALSKEWTACDGWRTLDTDRHVGKALPRLVVPGSGPLAAQPGARLTFIYLYGAG